MRELRDQQQSAAEQLQQAQTQWAAQDEPRQTLDLLEQLAPQRHQFAQLAALDTQLSPMAEQMAAQEHQHATLHAQQLQLEQTLDSARLAASQAQTQQQDSAPRLKQAHVEQANLQRLNAELDKQRTLAQQAEQACETGQQALNTLLERHQHSTEQLALIAQQLEHSAELAPLANAWDAYRPRLQQLVRLSNTLSTGRQELPALEQRALQAAQQITQLRDSLEILFQEAVAEPQALNEQIHTLGSLLKDNRQQQRDVEDLQRLCHSQQALDTRLQALQSKLQALQTEREQRIEQGTETKNTTRAPSRRCTSPANCLSASAWPALPASKSCANSCKMISRARCVAATNTPITSPKRCCRA